MSKKLRKWVSSQAINLSILDFKCINISYAFNMFTAINLSILDFKFPYGLYGRIGERSINLSILDFKLFDWLSFTVKTHL